MTVWASVIMVREHLDAGSNDSKVGRFWAMFLRDPRRAMENGCTLERRTGCSKVRRGRDNMVVKCKG